MRLSARCSGRTAHPGSRPRCSPGNSPLLHVAPQCGIERVRALSAAKLRLALRSTPPRRRLHTTGPDEVRPFRLSRPGAAPPSFPTPYRFPGSRCPRGARRRSLLPPSRRPDEDGSRFDTPPPRIFFGKGATLESAARDYAERAAAHAKRRWAARNRETYGAYASYTAWYATPVTPPQILNARSFHAIAAFADLPSARCAHRCRRAYHDFDAPRTEGHLLVVAGTAERRAPWAPSRNARSDANVGG